MPGARRVIGVKVTKAIVPYKEESSDIGFSPAFTQREGEVESSTAPPVKVEAKAVALKTARPPVKAQALPAQEVFPAQEEALQQDLSKYNELEKFAQQIVKEETKNPYKNTDPSPSFPLKTRLGFQQGILEVYSSFMKIQEHGKEPDYDACKKLTSGQQQEVEMYEYQKFVREYVRQASPYRGLLVYHGLGSGKTCSAIAAAEALFSVSNKRIIVMTPFSLRDNFIREVSFCGFRHFRLENHWVNIDKNPTTSLFATEILRITPDFLKKMTSIWIPDFEQPSNYNTLSTNERQEIMKQLGNQITSKIQFINYNGITSTKLKELACRPPDANGNGPFDNAVIVVDEIHNLTRLMQGTIEPYLTSLPGLKRKVPLEPVSPGRWKPALCEKTTDPSKPYLTNYKRGYLLYRLLEGARNSKIIGLSGTPLINFPEEIAILMNIIGGYIHTASFKVSPASDQNQRAIRKILLDHPFIDFQEVKLEGLNMSVLITCLPEGMQKTTTTALGVRKIQEQTPTIQENTNDVIESIKKAGMKILGQPEYKSEALLPPVGQDFRDNFLESDGTTLKNKMVIRKRIQGLISYYRGSKKELMPRISKDELVKIPFTPYAQAEYIRTRSEELKQQEKKKKQPVAVGGLTGKMANLWADLYELGKTKSSTSYRMFSRQACNFAFPEGITRPRPMNQQQAIEEIGKDVEIKNDYFEDDAQQLLSAEEGEVSLEDDAEGDAALGEGNEGQAEAEDEQIEKAEEAEFIEDVDAPEAREAEEAEDEFVQISQGAVGDGKQGEQEAPLKLSAVPERMSLTAVNTAKTLDAELREKCKAGYIQGEPYLQATARAKKCLRSFATPNLRLYPRSSKKIVDQIKENVPIDPKLLQKYSPKYAKILVNILESAGSNLVYSQFLDMEGIGIFQVILEINEFQPIRIEMRDGLLKFTEDTVKSLQRGPGVNRYLSFTGSEDRSVRSMALKVFNAKFSEESQSYSELPDEMSATLVNSGFKRGNLFGEICRVFCITSAGAEGLSLRNVRRVHIMEPYWNPVRTDQVKGRAVRICSHIDLDLDQRDVEVYTYCSVFNTEALLHPSGSTEFGTIDMTILGGDGLKPADAEKIGIKVPPGIKDYIMTSDEYLYCLSENKRKILQNIQDLMKTSSVDCQLNYYENSDDNLGCIVIEGTPEQYAFHPDLAKDISETSTKYKDVAPVGAFSSSAREVDALKGLANAKAAAKADAPKGLANNYIEIKAFRDNGVDYMAVPVQEPGGGLLNYDIYLRGDESLIKKVGTMVAGPKGALSKKGFLLF
jgi:hypothetical protein